ncbi:lasso RiPP family leader peptide-containing protein [Kineococcus sp. SYSU DK003]|uniref:lasso RiPP family leader peptide-containing protein n=1 Tax=Kineococcus sp. SYSU DK003 TaxID=3383124 RepID=UPI003D7EFA21
MNKAYEAPTMTTLGSLADLTLAPKQFGQRSDGDFLNGSGLYTVSCECNDVAL